jgi:hypothetical protein
LEGLLAPDANGSRVDIFDRQINRALSEAQAVLRVDGVRELPGDEALPSDRLSAVKKACDSLTPRERAELVRWLTGGAAGE